MKTIGGYTFDEVYNICIINLSHKMYKRLYFWHISYLQKRDRGIDIRPFSISTCLCTDIVNQTRLAKCIIANAALLALIRGNVIYQTVVKFCMEFAMCSLLCHLESALH